MKYQKGDCIDIAKKLAETKPVVIPHITNNIQAWGSGFVMALSKEWPVSVSGSPEAIYHSEKQLLGTVKYAYPQGNICVANMCAQHGISSKSTGPKSKVNTKPIRYEELVHCMGKIRDLFFDPYQDSQWTIVAPKFGSLRAGGNWSFIEELIEEIWCDFEVIICEI